MEETDIYILLMLALLCRPRPVASLVTPCPASLATPCHSIGDALFALLGWQPKRGLLTTRPGVQKQKVCSTVLSEVDSVHSGGFFSLPARREGFLITARRAGVALKMNKIGFACKGIVPFKGDRLALAALW